jgi:hypothetical protein
VLPASHSSSQPAARVPHVLQVRQRHLNHAALEAVRRNLQARNKEQETQDRSAACSLLATAAMCRRPNTVKKTAATAVAICASCSAAWLAFGSRKQPAGVLPSFQSCHVACYMFPAVRCPRPCPCPQLRGRPWFPACASPASCPRCEC